MGNELKCKVRFGSEASEGKALLESNELILRGPFGLKIPFAQMKSVEAVKGELRVEFTESGATKRAQPATAVVVLELGPHADKWAQKILHPKSRIEKLGIKAGAKVSLLGELDKEFEPELAAVTSAITRGKVAADAEWVFVCAESRKKLEQAAKVAKSVSGSTALWIVYPKGRKDITEKDVIGCGRRAGLKDVKVVGFSPTHTALKFVLPLTAR